MSVRERERLIARIRQLRRVFADTDERARPAPKDPVPDGLRALEDRITHLERLVEGLQDSVHRESMRLGKRLTELETRVQPAALGKALSEDARERGL
jgi:uncharacterized coiled-coil protein SlyX